MRRFVDLPILLRCEPDAGGLVILRFRPLGLSTRVVGGLVMAVLNNGLQLMGVGSDRVQIIKGLVLLLAVAIDVYNKSQGRFSIIGRDSMVKRS